MTKRFSIFFFARIIKDGNKKIPIPRSRDSEWGTF